MGSPGALQLARFVMLFVVLATLCACEEDVTDLSLDDASFTIYGIVNPKADTQFVRVFAISEVPSAHADALPEATVRFIDLTTGATHEAYDSLAVFGEGRFGHVFWAPFRAEFDRSYRIEVQGAAGSPAHATVTTPPASDIAMLEAFTRFDPAERDRVPIVPVRLRRTGGLLQRMEAVYYVEAHNIGREWHVIPYDLQVDDVGDGWQIEVDLVRDYHTIYEQWEQVYRDHEVELRRRGVECCRVEFYGLEVVATVVDTTWTPPGGAYDPELLIQPGTMDNVENGFGFVGAGYDEVADIRVPRCLQYWSGYVFADNPCTQEDYCRYRGEQCG